MFTYTYIIIIPLFIGDIADEIHQVFNTWVRQVIRIYKGENNVEFEWLIGPIPVE